MHNLHLTDHAEVRMRQRGFRKVDVDLVLRMGTNVSEDAVILTDQDVAREIKRRKYEIQQLERLRGSKMIVEGDTLVTLYHMTKKPDSYAGKSKRNR